MKKEPLKLGDYTIVQWYRAAFIVLGFALVCVVVAECGYFLLAAII